MDHITKHKLLDINEFIENQAKNLKNKLDSADITEATLNENIRSVKSQFLTQVNIFKN